MMHVVMSYFYCKSLQGAGRRTWGDPGFGEVEFGNTFGEADSSLDPSQLSNRNCSKQQLSNTYKCLKIYALPNKR